MGEQIPYLMRQLTPKNTAPPPAYLVAQSALSTSSTFCKYLQLLLTIHRSVYSMTIDAGNLLCFELLRRGAPLWGNHGKAKNEEGRNRQSERRRREVDNGL